MCLHTTICVLILLYVSSYYYTCVLVAKVYNQTYLRPSKPIGAGAWFGFFGLQAQQDVRAGDTYALDYVLDGFTALAPVYR